MQCDRSQQQKKKKEREIQGGILGSEKPRSISNQDNCHVPGAGISLIFRFKLCRNHLKDIAIVPHFTHF